MGKIVTWQEVAAQKKDLQSAQIPDKWKLKNVNFPRGSNVMGVPTTCGILTPEEIRITSDYDAVDIVQLIKNKTFSAEAVTTAFCKRAAIAQQLANCLTEIFFGEAIEAAKALDARRKSDPNEPLKPLHGLPISLKDSFNLPGKDSTIGLICYANDPAPETACLAELLQSLGAILYCKTNVPQTMMTADSDNNVFGRTLNPHNTALTAGGSTGGEGALIALRGSIAGIGSDIAGSIRIPSLCNGIYGFKPTSQIVPFSGQRSPIVDGIPCFLPSAGPMASSIRSCRFLLETIMRAEPWKQDASCLRITWRGLARPTQAKQLRIGIVTDDGAFTVTPPVRRGFNESMSKLKSAGVTAVPVTLPNVPDILEACWRFFALDGAQFIHSAIAAGKEPLVPSVQKSGTPLGAPATLSDLCKLNAGRAQYMQLYTEIWKSHKLDAVMLPPAPYTAVPHDHWGPINYTVLWNYLDYPACVIPVGHVAAEDVRDGNAKYGAEDLAVYDLYTGPSGYHDAPTAVQLVGQRYDDEKLAGLAEFLDEIINTRV